MINNKKSHLKKIIENNLKTVLLADKSKMENTRLNMSVLFQPKAWLIKILFCWSCDLKIMS